jgi:hypothetical protein
MGAEKTSFCILDAQSVKNADSSIVTIHWAVASFRVEANA